MKFNMTLVFAAVMVALFFFAFYMDYNKTQNAPSFSDTQPSTTITVTIPDTDKDSTPEQLNNIEPQSGK